MAVGRVFYTASFTMVRLAEPVLFYQQAAYAEGSVGKNGMRRVNVF